MKFRLIESDGDFYDYKTGDVVDDILFDEKRAEASYYNGVMNEPDYYRDYKNKKGKIVYLSPNEYYKICADDIFHVDINRLKDERAYDKKNIDFLKSVILVQKKKFPVPIIDYTSRGQEGLHRMMVAGELVGWDTKQPVLIIDWADEERHKQDVERDRRSKIYTRIENAVKSALRYKYSNIEEFIEQLEWDMNNNFEYTDYYDEENQSTNFTTKQSDSDCIITVDDVSYTFPIDKIKIEPDEEDDDIDLDDVDISDVDFSDEDWWKNLK